ADLVRLRQVGVVVVLAVEDCALGDLAVERDTELDALLDGPPVRNGQRTRERKADRADVRVRLRAELVRAATEHLRPRLELHVDLEPDDGFPAAAHDRSLVGTPSKASARSSACPARKSMFSENCGPISCRPTGRPSESPHGMLRPGRPAMHDGIVSRSFRYIASGLSAFSPILNATVGLVGETIRSKDSKTSACSRRITVRTFCAVP